MISVHLGLAGRPKLKRYNKIEIVRDLSDSIIASQYVHKKHHLNFIQKCRPETTNTLEEASSLESITSVVTHYSLEIIYKHSRRLYP